jgi:multicomponent Na+:H+ antiporter subunit E
MRQVQSERPREASGAAGGSTRWLLRGSVFAILWLVLTDADPSSWIIGGPAVIAATAAAQWLNPLPRRRISPAGLAAFVPYFVWRSLAGSVDVAWRAFHPALPISPCLMDFPLRLPDVPERVFFADVVNLLPGTLSAELHDDSITLHLLNGESTRALDDLRRLEARVAALFGMSLRRVAGSGSSDE